MALTDILSLVDDKLREVFHKPEPKKFNHEKAREPIIKGLERTKDQLAAGAPVKGKKWFKQKNDVVELTLPFSLDGKTNIYYVPSERASEFMISIIKEIRAGNLDKQIEAGAAEPKAKTKRVSPTAGSGWTQERRDRFNASVAARNAAKNGV